MNVHAKPMKISEVKKISLPVLKARLATYGFSDAEIIEDESFDGAPVFRIDAEVKRKVPANVIVDTLDVIHSSLRAKGEERIVFLTAKLPQTGESTGVEEDID